MAYSFPVQSRFFPRQENPDGCRDQEQRCHSDKQPLKGVEGRTHDSSFRVAEIPAQVWAVDHGQSRESGHEKCTECDQGPVEDISTKSLSAGELQIDDLQLFCEGFDCVRLRLCHSLPQQRAHGRLQGLRQGNQQIRIRDRQSRFTQLKIRAWKAGLCCRQSGKRFRFPGPGFPRCL